VKGSECLGTSTGCKLLIEFVRTTGPLWWGNSWGGGAPQFFWIFFWITIYSPWLILRACRLVVVVRILS
jgi:hypothetical protein